MEKYVKPMCLANEDLAEGVYAASGDCYTFTAVITQTPELGRPSYTVTINGVHAADHHSASRSVVITFNQVVEYVSSKAESYSGSGTNVIRLVYTDGVGGDYHNNGNDKIGLGDLIVTSGAGLSILRAACDYCDRDCGKH